MQVRNEQITSRSQSRSVFDDSGGSHQNKGSRKELSNGKRSRPSTPSPGVGPRLRRNSKAEDKALADSSHRKGGPGVARHKASSSSMISQSLDGHSASIDTAFSGSGKVECKPEVARLPNLPPCSVGSQPGERDVCWRKPKETGRGGSLRARMEHVIRPRPHSHPGDPADGWHLQSSEE